MGKDHAPEPELRNTVIDVLADLADRTDEYTTDVMRRAAFNAKSFKAAQQRAAEQEPTLSPEDQMELLKGQVNSLLLAGSAVARQLQEHGKHQTNFYGHFRNDCRTCIVGKEYNTVAQAAEQVLGELFPQNPSQEL